MIDSSNTDFGRLKEIIKIMSDERGKFNKDRILEILGTLPWDPQQLISLYFKNPQNTKIAVECLPGYKIARQFYSIELAYKIFISCANDLIQHIYEYKNSKKLFPKNPFIKSKFDDVQIILNKSLFSFSSSAAALREQQRKSRKKKLVSEEEYDVLLNKIWGDDGLFDFIISIRNVSCHAEIIESNFHIKRSINKDENRIIFIDKDLILASEINSKAKKFIKSNKELNIEQIATALTAKASNFNTSLLDRIYINNKSAVREYVGYENFLTYIQLSAELGILKQIKGNILTYPPLQKQEVEKLVQIKTFPETINEFRKLLELKYKINPLKLIFRHSQLPALTLNCVPFH